MTTQNLNIKLEVTAETQAVCTRDLQLDPSFAGKAIADALAKAWGLKIAIEWERLPLDQHKNPDGDLGVYKLTLKIE